ncbi:MAG: restriction endonuclease [Planctomycetaceae bacterium]
MAPEQEHTPQKPAADTGQEPYVFPEGTISPHERTRHEAGELGKQVETLEAERVVLEAQTRQQRNRVRKLRLELAVRNAVARVRRLADRVTPWRSGAFGLCVVITGALAAIIRPSLLSLLLGFAVGAIVFGFLLLFPHDEAAEETRRDRQAELEQAVAYCSEVAQQAERHRRELAETRAQHEDVVDGLRRKQLTQSNPQRRDHLAKRNWKAMRGGQFEKFLVIVFEELGYNVDEAAGKKDQPGELVLTKSDRRVFVHAKGYFHSVPDSAVEAAHAGMARHRCHRCAVVTNSQFTQSARELANTIGCVLVDAGSMGDLIRGQVEL